jgi:flagellar biosynthetic protein FliQ|tara:strand:- start:1334 stop:1711 length:378 start_codon:yes stop_codon:yes gene_type:complete
MDSWQLFSSSGLARRLRMSGDIPAGSFCRCGWGRNCRVNEVDAIAVSREAMQTILMVSGPIMGVALLTGLLISLFQALTQLQEMTLVFVPKILVVFIALLTFAPFMLSQLTSFVTSLTDRIIGLG